MKRSCKNIDIKNPKVILPYIAECINRHYKRYDFMKLLINHGLKKEDYYKAITEQDKSYFNDAIFAMAKEVARTIAGRDASFTPPRIRLRPDKSTGKERLIGVESAYQQLFDYIAVRSCNDIWQRRMVAQQFSSIPGRGQLKGMQCIKGYITSDSRASRYAKSHSIKYTRKCKYFVKMDIKKCYPSANKEIFTNMLARDLGNADIMYVWQILLKSHGEAVLVNNPNEKYNGFLIGALPSQWAAQYMLSFIYKYAMTLKYARRGKEHKAVNHMVMFMDDMLLISSNRKELKKAVNKIISYAKNKLGFTIKPNWHIQDFAKNNIYMNDDTVSGIDMMGFVVYPSGKVGLRGRNFVKSRRLIIRWNNAKRMTLEQAKRLSSYKGFYIYTDGHNIEAKLNVAKAFSTASKIISDNAKGARRC